MSPQNDELRQWSQAWQAVEPDLKIDATALRAEVKRRTRRFRVWLIIETAIMLVVLIGLPIFAWRTRDVADAALASVFCVLVVIGMIRNFSIARLHWRPSIESTSGFIDLMRRRALVTRQQIRLGWGLLAIEIAVFIPWISHTLRRKYGADIPLEASIRAWSHLAVLVGIAAVVLWVMQRRCRADRRRWEQLRSQTAEE